VLGHAETLLATVRHLITNANSAAHFLHPRAATGAKLYGGERIALIIKRREAANAASGDRAWGKLLHARDVLRTATEPMTAKEIASGVPAAASITDASQAQIRELPGSVNASLRNHEAMACRPLARDNRSCSAGELKRAFAQGPPASIARCYTRANGG
jgi:hypothetical protein